MLPQHSLTSPPALAGGDCGWGRRSGSRIIALAGQHQGSHHSTPTLGSPVPGMKGPATSRSQYWIQGIAWQGQFWDEFPRVPRARTCQEDPTGRTAAAHTPPCHLSTQQVPSHAPLDSGQVTLPPRSVGHLRPPTHPGPARCRELAFLGLTSCSYHFCHQLPKRMIKLWSPSPQP